MYAKNKTAFKRNETVLSDLPWTDSRKNSIKY